ncbi:hypothetical protein [Parashewanella tropica]|uniref:hypothetical protein n=1 Tax=Parashewanella tropica TaxID=2547970 RepID=UPI00105A61E2|nr:hypothetical protein [Parashewanella tropica]
MSYKGLLVVSLSLFLNACFDGSSSKHKSIAVIADDDYLQNAMVCSDCNNNLACDTDEMQTSSNDDGFVFSQNLNLSCPTLAVISPNTIKKMSSVQVEHEFKMVSPVDCDSISPMTSLLYQEMIHRGSKNKALKSLQDGMLTNLDLCKDFLKEKSLPISQSTPISKKEAEVYMQASKDYIANYKRRSDLIEADSQLGELPPSDKHKLITFSTLRRVHKYQKIPRFSFTEQQGSNQASVSSSNDNLLSQSESEDLKFEDQLRTYLENAEPANLFDVFNGNTSASLTRYHEVPVGLKSTRLQYNDSVLTEFQSYWPPKVNEVIEKPSVLGVDGIKGLSSSDNSVSQLSIYYNHKLYEQTTKDGDEVTGLELVNQSYRQLDYVVLSNKFSVSGIPVTTLMNNFPGIPSWGEASKNSNVSFPENDSSVAYEVFIVPTVDGVIYQDKSDCKPNADDPIEGLCHYVGVIRPHNRAKGAKNVTTYFDKRTKSGYIYQASVNEIPDVLYLGTANLSDKEEGAHILAYKETDEIFRIAVVNGDLSKLIIEEAGGPNNIYLQFYIPSGDPKIGPENVTDNDHFATTNWGTSTVNGHDVAGIIIPNSFRQLLPELPSILALTKVGGYDRQGDFVQRFGQRGTTLLGIEGGTIGFVEEAIQHRDD